MKYFKRIFRLTLSRIRQVCILLRLPEYVVDMFEYDAKRFVKHAGAFRNDNRETCLARVIMAYHVIEKGLTMPRRRLDFGHDAVRNLINAIDDYTSNFGRADNQILHAIGCVKEYYLLHKESGFDMKNCAEYWTCLSDFCNRYADISRSFQREISCDELYANNDAAFPVFAASRITVRHFAGKIDELRLKKAVEIAITAPSACNRQYVRIYAIANHKIRDHILELQNGNRGFGGDADKLLIVTADLSGLRWAEERNDVFTNAGIMIMNLVYALHYEKIANCILNWSVTPAIDMQMRAIAGIPASENIAALILCGKCPKKFMVASSPRKNIEDVYKVIQ